jgi:hypothetical protein
MFLGGVEFHNSSGRTRAPSWCKVMWSDMKVLLYIPVRTCQTWDSLVYSLLQHAISDHSEALFTHCSLTLVITFWPIAGDNAVQPGESQQTFRRNISPTFSVSKSLLPVSCWFLVCLLFDRDDGRDMLLWNVDRLSPNYTALYPRRQN